MPAQDDGSRIMVVFSGNSSYRIKEGVEKPETKLSAIHSMRMLESDPGLEAVIRRAMSEGFEHVRNLGEPPFAGDLEWLMFFGWRTALQFAQEAEGWGI